MQIMVEFDPQTEAQLDALARQEGIDAPTLIKNLVVQHLPRPQKALDEDSRNLLALLSSWQEEDKTTDPEELERRDTETQEFLSNLKQNRVYFPTESE